MSSNTNKINLQQINVNDINDDSINELQKICQERELNFQTTEPITPRTKFAMKTLGFKKRDVTSIGHTFNTKQKKQILNIQKYTYYYYLNKNLNALQQMRTNIIENNLMPDKNENERILHQAMSQKINEANEIFNKSIKQFQKQTKRMVKSQSQMLQTQENYNKKLQKEKQQKQQELLQKQQKYQITLQKRFAEKKALQKKRNLKSRKDTKIALQSIQWIEKTKSDLKQKQLNDYDRKQKIRKRSFHNQMKRSASLSLLVAKNNTEIAKHRMEATFDEKIKKQQVFVHNKAQQFKNKIKKRQSDYEKRKQRLMAEEKERNKNLIRKLESNELRWQQRQHERNEQLLKEKQLRDKHRKIVQKTHQEFNKNTLLNMLSKQKEANERREKFQQNEKLRRDMKRTMYKLKQEEAFEKMKQFSRAKSFQNKLFNKKLMNQDHRYKTCKKMDTKILNYKLYSNGFIRSRIDDKMNDVSKQVHDGNIEGLSDMIETIDNETFGINNLSPTNLNQLMKHPTSRNQFATSGTAEMRKHKKIKLRHRI